MALTDPKKSQEIDSYVESSKNAISSVDRNQLTEVASEIVSRLKRGGKVVVMGNGGSAAEAQHFVAELVCRFEKERKSIPAIALTANSSNITAVANDYSYDQVFSRQISGLCRDTDIVVGLSTSGNSANVVHGLNAAKEIGCYTIALIGKKGKIAELDLNSIIKVDSERTANIQEAHLVIIHLLSKLVEDGF